MSPIRFSRVVGAGVNRERITAAGIQLTSFLFADFTIYHRRAFGVIFLHTFFARQY